MHSLIVFVLLILLIFLSLIENFEYNPYYSYWMENIKDTLENQTISQIFIPGTHESSSYNLSDVPSPDEDKIIRDLAKKYSKIYSQIVKPWGECQSLNTYGQLMNGARLLDWRISYREGGKQDPLGEVHDFFSCHGLWANRLSDMLNEVLKFLQESRDEIVFIEISHFNEFTLERYKKMQDLIISIVGDYMVQSSDFPHATKENFFETVTYREILESNQRSYSKNENRRRLFLFIEPFGLIQPNPIFFNYSLLNIPWSNQNDAIKAIADLELLMLNQSGTYNELYGVQFLLTPQFLDFALGILLEGIPGFNIDTMFKLANLINTKLDFFSEKWFSIRKVNNMIIDRIESTSLVDHAIYLNSWNCQDNPKYKDPKIKESCQFYKTQGRCDHQDDFMKNNCKFTCGLCPSLKGYPGSECNNSSDCKMEGSICKLNQCLIPNSYPLGHICGSNFQCNSGFCNPQTNLCSGRYIKDICETSSDCMYGSCQSGQCEGDISYKIIGESPICRTYEEDCLRSNMMYVSRLKGDSKGTCIHFEILDFKFDGRKMLCVNANISKKKYFWLKCGSTPNDCQSQGAEAIFENNCGEDSCCDNEQKQILCAV